MLKRIVIVMLLVSVLAACQVIGGDGGDDNNNTVDNAPQASVIQWERDPNNIVFRAEVIGGEDAFYRRNEVPTCTVYGDNHVVWTVTSGNNNTQVLHDRVEDDRIVRFVEDLTLGFRIYDFDTAAELAGAGVEEPVVEQFTLNVNGIVHVTDAFGGWDYEYFERILEICRSISPAPAIYEPTAAWVSAIEVEYESDVPSILWNGEGRGLDLADLAASGERQWIDNVNVRVLWDILQNSVPNIQFDQGGQTFNVALEVPNITILSPPPPGEGGDDDNAEGEG